MHTGKVLVTGVNGFIGAWTLKAFLEAGYAVRGTVRDESKVTHLRSVFAEHAERLEFAIVPDITEVGRQYLDTRMSARSWLSSTYRRERLMKPRRE